MKVLVHPYLDHCLDLVMRVGLKDHPNHTYPALHPWGQPLWKVGSVRDTKDYELTTT